MNKPASPNEVIPPRREPILPNAVMGMMMFVAVEVAAFSLHWCLCDCERNILWPPLISDYL